VGSADDPAAQPDGPSDAVPPLKGVAHEQVRKESIATGTIAWSALVGYALHLFLYFLLLLPPPPFPPHGSIDLRYLTSFSYARSFGGVLLWVVVFLTAGGWVALNIVSTLWLSTWVADDWNRSAAFYAAGYTGIVCATCLMIFGRGLAVAVGAVQAATRLHQRLLTAIMGAKMTFFDTELTVTHPNVPFCVSAN
jgi:hypothetical protein